MSPVHLKLDVRCNLISSLNVANPLDSSILTFGWISPLISLCWTSTHYANPSSISGRYFFSPRKWACSLGIEYPLSRSSFANVVLKSVKCPKNTVVTQRLTEAGVKTELNRDGRTMEWTLVCFIHFLAHWSVFMIISLSWLSEFVPSHETLRFQLFLGSLTYGFGNVQHAERPRFFFFGQQCPKKGRSCFAVISGIAICLTGSGMFPLPSLAALRDGYE